MRIGIVTCKVLPEPDPDAAPLAAALASAGHEVIPAPWDAGDPPEVDRFVIRSAWNYFEDHEAFCEWIDRAALIAPVINSSQIVRWNIHKKYLLELSSNNVPVIPTTIIAQGDIQTDMPDTPFSLDEGTVIKPAISAGSFDTRRFAGNEQSLALQWLNELAGEGDVLVQPYMDGFRDPGEESLIHIDGVWTHTIRKHPRYAGQDERVESSGPPTDEVLRVANAALSVVPYAFGYARADLIQDAAGRVMISELELMEPSLFFDESPEALSRFVALITRDGK